MKAKHMVKLLGAGQQAPAPRLSSADVSDGRIRAFADAVLAGEAPPEDARTILKEFVRMARPGNVVSDAMIGFLSEAFERFMRGECDIVQALGLAKPRRRGRPPRDRAQCIEVAMHVLLLQIKERGSVYSENDAASRFDLKKTVIRERVAACRDDAIKEIRARLNKGRLVLTPKQRANLDRLERVTLRPRTAHLRNPTRNRLATIPPDYSS